MSTMIQSTQRPPAELAATTWPPMSAARAEGILWAERLFSQTRAADGDVERFAASLEADE